MARKRKPTMKQAKAWAIRVYTLALKKAEKGDWEGAQLLTEVEWDACSFCRHHDGDCEGACVVSHLCAGGDLRSREANLNAWMVLRGDRTPKNGLRHFKRTIEQLEKLEV